MSDIPITFEAISGESYVSLERYNSPKDKIFKYIFNDEEQKLYRIGDKLLLNEGDKVSFISYSIYCSTDKDNYYRFFTEGQGKVNIYGNVNSLINYNEDLMEFIFYKLFHNCRNIIDASQLELPSNNLIKGCYQCMFENCFNLQKAPQLPAECLDQCCYLGMFRQCISLIQPPEILPALNLKERCYANMFEKCLSLTYSPYIKSNYPTQNSCIFMFYNCQNLSTITVNFIDWNLKYTPTDVWVNCVAKYGIFKMPSELSIVRGKNNIPKCWSIETLN